MEKMVIIGSEGFIGQRLVDYFKNKFLIFGVDKKEYSGSGVYHYIRRDIIFDDITDLGDQDYSYVINCASILGIERVMNNPLQVLETNSNIAIHILKLLKKQSNLKKYIYLSSSEVYGKRSKNAIESQDLMLGIPSESRWTYGLSKLFSESYTLHYSKIYNIPSIIVRPFNIYGIGRIEGAINKIVHDILHKQIVTITGTGNQKRAWCHISDFINGIDLLLKSGQDLEVYNIGNPNEYKSINEIVDLAQIESGKRVKIIKEELLQDIQDRCPNISKIQALGFKPQKTLKEGIREVIDYEKS